MPSPPPPDRSHLLTEQRNPRSMDLDTLSVRACVELMHAEDRVAVDAVALASEAIASFIESAESRMREGGRLIYLGAGTSGRLGVLGASECPPTFQTDPGLIVGLIAGGDPALRTSSESKEDEHNGAVPELDALKVGSRDTVLGIAAGGTTPWVLGGLEHAHGSGALTGLLACAEIDRQAWIDHPIVVRTGPEIVTGSTRMKAGTATKLVLNMITTCAMVRLGKVHGNLMVDLRATNDKLRDRGARIITELLGVERGEALELLERAHGEVKRALVMHARGVGFEEAGDLIEAHGGVLRPIIGDPR